MAETIYTIPINEAFDASIAEGKGCPFCRLYEKFESDELELILGGSMMEPDVRIQTNQYGFCRRHYNKLLEKKNRLGLALILESHLNELRKEMKGGFQDALKYPGAKALTRIEELEKSCYLCKKIGTSFSKMTDNAVYLWEQDYTFRKKAAAVPYYCLPHLKMFAKEGKLSLSKKEYALFYKQISESTFRYFSELTEDVSFFCKKFDYRYDEEPWGNSKDSVERAVQFLSVEGENLEK